MNVHWLVFKNAWDHRWPGAHKDRQKSIYFVTLSTCIRLVCAWGLSELASELMKQARMLFSYAKRWSTRNRKKKIFEKLKKKCQAIHFCFLSFSKSWHHFQWRVVVKLWEVCVAYYCDPHRNFDICKHGLSFASERQVAMDKIVPPNLRCSLVLAESVLCRHQQRSVWHVRKTSNLRLSFLILIWQHYFPAFPSSNACTDFLSDFFVCGAVII